MVLSDFLSRQLGDKSDPHQIIPISFNIKEVLSRNYQNNTKAAFMVHTRSQSKGVKAPAVQKTLNPSNRDLLCVNDQQNCTQARKTTNSTVPAINQPYPQLA